MRTWWAADTGFYRRKRDQGTCEIWNHGTRAKGAKGRDLCTTGILGAHGQL